VVTAGNPYKGKLGHVEHKEKKSLKRLKPKLYADKSLIDFIANPEGNSFKQVACGTDHTVALSSSGEVYTWGWGKEGALGHGTSEQ